MILSLTGVGKAYRQYGNEWKRVLSWLGMPCKPLGEQWTLHDISFMLNQGESLGIIGSNGAGKSTLLKMITGTLKPSAGSIQVRGKIAAILELGMGFHPDMTGRQNAYHAAGLMGYMHAQIEAIMDQIEAFAEIGDYFDRPVRLYSSGMQVRVAFAVATAFRPEILIIDEALSVGDAYFQHKSFERIRHFKTLGTTLIFVSHDKGSVLALCDRVILLDQGVLLKDGKPEEVTDYYNALIAQKEGETIVQEKTDDGRVLTFSGTKEATVEELVLCDIKGEAVEYVHVGDEVVLHVRVRVHQNIPALVFGYAIKDRLGQVMYGTNTWHTQQCIEEPKAGSVYHFTVRFRINLGVGHYSVVTALTDAQTHLSMNYEWRDLALIFNVVNTHATYFNGLLWSEPLIRITNE